jgi:hypothetical protein
MCKISEMVADARAKAAELQQSHVLAENQVCLSSIAAYFY